MLQDIVLPTIKSEQNNIIHIVETRQSTVCGLVYNKFSILKKEDLKSIHFKRFKLITCKTCIENTKEVYIRHKKR